MSPAPSRPLSPTASDYPGQTWFYEGKTWNRRLNLAIRWGDTGRVYAMLDQLAKDPTLGDLNASNIETDEVDDQQGTPLEVALYQGHADLVEHLARNPRVDVNRVGLHDWTPLHLATLFSRSGQRVRMVAALLNAGADPHALGEHVWNERDSDRWSYDTRDEQTGRTRHVTQMSVVETVAYMGGKDTGDLLDLLDRHGALPPLPDRISLLELVVRAPSNPFFGGAAYERSLNTCRTGLQWLLDHGTVLTPPATDPSSGSARDWARLAHHLRDGSPRTHERLELQLLNEAVNDVQPNPMPRSRPRL